MRAAICIILLWALSKLTHCSSDCVAPACDSAEGDSVGLLQTRTAVKREHQHLQDVKGEQMVEDNGVGQLGSPRWCWRGNRWRKCRWSTCRNMCSYCRPATTTVTTTTLEMRPT